MASVERAMVRAFVACCLFAVGCGTPKYAVVDGKRVERPSVEYGSDFFWIEHERAFPGVFDPHRGLDVNDGTLRGQVCKININFDASWYGDRLTLQGRGDTPELREWSYNDDLFHAEVHIRESAPGHRHIIAYGLVPEVQKVEVDVSDQRLEATIGRRHYELAADGGYLFGRLMREGDVWEQRIDAPFAIYGRQVLSSMVPADEAIVLIFMLACDGPTVEHDGQLVRGFSMVTLPPKP